MTDEHKIVLKAQEIFDHDIVDITEWTSSLCTLNVIHLKANLEDLKFTYVVKPYLKPYILHYFDAMPTESTGFSLEHYDKSLIWCTNREVTENSNIILAFAEEKLRRKGIIK